jgi:two-component system sensor histidine kinase YesM
VALVRLLKQSISKQDELIPVEEELHILRNYVFIQQIKYGDRLQVEYDIDEAVFPYSILKFVLQPIVENAIFHGLEPKKGKGAIRVSAYMSQDDLVFEIADDGVGMPAEKLPSLLEAEENEGGFGEVAHKGGFRNVHGRARLYFGEAYGLSIRSETGKGTTVRLRVPAIHKWDEVKDK